MIISQITGGNLDITKERLLKSPLFPHIKDYLEKPRIAKKIYLFIPYIQTDVLEKLVSDITDRIIIVTSWRTSDLLSGSSRLDLYPFCKLRNITLYINNKIHLKAYSNNLDDVIVATANISKRGLEDVEDANIECGVYTEIISNNDRLYFANIIQESRLVNEEMYQSLLDWYNKQDKPAEIHDIFDSIILPPERDAFLISALPMTSTVEILEEAYLQISNNFSPIVDNETRDCIFHDLANFNIKLGLRQADFRKQLKTSFFSHPFIKKIDSMIDSEIYFGRLKEWIQMNCTDVPIPSRRALTGNVQVLFKWFESLGNGNYVVDIPGVHSQRLRKIISESK
jgi:hypothetical protein